ncbi:hypothetical protein N0V93_004622 [Gnomoniopsis smithogilvyi]|uniref:Integral membrane protein TmpA n=1 Tax=Gnomoniopsis smithogilvyi TaxID=1191159 RepID=A0A9W9CXA8_9PEZI|nr:hypothetical protein N0V93_004622 [Gnomoniopsis smithogilvyi]
MDTFKEDKLPDAEKTIADINIRNVNLDGPGADALCSPSSSTAFTELKPLPAEKKSSRPYRQARHVYFTVYRRLFAIILILNIIGLIVLETRPYDLEHYLRSISSAASSNFCLAILARQDYIINGLFDLYVLIPKSAPLALRRRVAKVYEFGGVHSGAAFCATLWFLRMVILLTLAFRDGTLGDNIPGLALVWVVLLLFVGIIVFAHPSLRTKQHDTFERTHRFAGWVTNALFWVLVVLASMALANREEDPRSTGQVLVTLPSFWMLTLNTVHTLIPWIRLRKLPATAEPLSSMAVRLHLKANIKPFYTIRLSDSPLTEWHSFACFPDSNPINGSTNSVIIAKAGDWTSSVISSPKPYYWTRGLPTRGVLYMSLLFKRVVVVTTGSGIGPCLNLLGMKPETRPACRVLWSTPNPGEFYGDSIINEVKQCDPNAVVWDTKSQGRPDMVELTWKLVMEMDAEAVFCVSNPKVTKKVVYGMESRGIPAYGPIFDS